MSLRVLFSHGCIYAAHRIRGTFVVLQGVCTVELVCLFEAYNVSASTRDGPEISTQGIHSNPETSTHGCVQENAHDVQKGAGIIR